MAEETRTDMTDMDDTVRHAVHDPDEFGGREGLPTGQHYTPTPAELRARNVRNVAVALAVLVFVVIVYATTTLRMKGAIEAGREAGGPVFVTDDKE